MSTILEAMRERAADAGPPMAWRDDRRWTRWRWPTVAVAATSAVVLGLLVRRSSPPADPEPAPAAAMAPPFATAPALDTAPTTRPAPVAPTREVDEPPRGRVERWRPAGPPPLASNAVAPRGTPAAPLAPIDAPVPEYPASPSRESGVPSVVELEGIRHAEAPGQRSVMLAIDGAAPVRLRQGEAAGGIEVQLILPDAVYVRRGGDVFAVGEVR